LTVNQERISSEVLKEAVENFLEKKAEKLDLKEVKKAALKQKHLPVKKMYLPV
jgi:Arc/MetJ-type ribon-helix-helix transcriptional regulator